MTKLFNFDSRIYIETRLSDLSYVGSWIAIGALIAAAGFIIGSLPFSLPLSGIVFASIGAGLVANEVLENVIDSTLDWATYKPVIY